MADVAVHGLKLRSLPTQDNHCDCGLFVLCAVLFFCHANPKVLDIGVLLALNGANVKGEAGGGREISSRFLPPRVRGTGAMRDDALLTKPMSGVNTKSTPALSCPPTALPPPSQAVMPPSRCCRRS